METVKESLRKQLNNKETMNADYTQKKSIIVNFEANVAQKCYHLIQPYSKPPTIRKRHDEPIDLTNQNRVSKIQNPRFREENLIRFVKRENREKPLCHNNVPDIQQLQCFFKDVIELQGPETKQVEIWKAARSLFSKRTRTLYHWMYPNTPKQHIKMAVANSWENLGVQEKQFYISQVLVRFGFPQCNLMINPQLGGIKELPPLPDSFDYSANELQTAISSISETAASASEMRRRQGRPPGSKNKKISKNELHAYKMIRDFQDDPELSNELEKFAVSFDYLK